MDSTPKTSPITLAPETPVGFEAPEASEASEASETPETSEASPEPAPVTGPTKASVGVVGLGLVGTALAQRLMQAGYVVWGYDQHLAASQRWLASAAPGCQVAASLPAMAAGCSAVVLAVYDTAGVLDVVEGPQGLLAQTGVQVLVDCSTGEPETLQALSQRLLSCGVDFLEAPLSGSSEQIANGQATLLLGASLEAAARHDRLLLALSPQRVHVGGAGMGARAKLATNLVLGLNRAALAEGLVFAEKLGIAPATFLALVLQTPARSEAAVGKGAAMVQGHFAPQSRIHQHLKDLRLMLAAAQSAGQRLPLTQVHAELLQAAVLQGDGELDNAAIVQQMRRETC